MATSAMRQVIPEVKSLKETVAERRATPKFDGSGIAEEALREILRAGALAPSGYNLQPWRFIVVREMKQKRRLREAAMGQSKVEEAGAIIVCCGDPDAVRGESLDKVLAESARHGFSEEQNQQVRDAVTSAFSAAPGDAMGMGPDEAVWLNRHVMIAFTTMMWTAEVLGYDTAPMEGFSEHKVRAVLGVPERMRVVALLAIGRRKGTDKPFAGRRAFEEICFGESWGSPLGNSR
jgi:nitroreductase